MTMPSVSAVQRSAVRHECVLAHHTIRSTGRTAREIGRTKTAKPNSTAAPDTLRAESPDGQGRARSTARNARKKKLYSVSLSMAAVWNTRFGYSATPNAARMPGERRDQAPADDRGEPRSRGTEDRLDETCGQAEGSSRTDRGPGATR